MPNDDLRNADLSHLRVQEMTPEQRAELRRRYDDFLERVVKPTAARAPAAPRKKVQAWAPPRAR